MKNQDRLTALKEFLVSPQKTGVWCLRIDFTQESREEFDKLFRTSNIRASYMANRPISSPVGRYDNVELPPTRWLRMFAFLRASSKVPVDGSASLLHSKYTDSPVGPNRFSFTRKRIMYNLVDQCKIPKTVSLNKKKSLARSLKVFQDELIFCRVHPVPENNSKLDLINLERKIHFQVTEEISGALRFYCIDQAIISDLKAIFEYLPIKTPKIEVLKIFSPSESLIEMMFPAITLLPRSFLTSERRALQNLEQIVTEISEERFVHSIRAAGIAVEEIVGEIFEAYFSKSAPEIPLGSLLSEINRRVSKATGKNGDDSGDVSKQIEVLLANEKSKETPNKEVLQLAAHLKSAFKSLREISEMLQITTMKSQYESLFPASVSDIFKDFLPLRNKVSHRADRARTISTIGYIEATTALRSLVALSFWWESERRLLNYSEPVLEQTLRRNRKHAV